MSKDFSTAEPVQAGRRKGGCKGVVTPVRRLLARRHPERAELVGGRLPLRWPDPKKPDDEVAPGGDLWRVALAAALAPPASLGSLQRRPGAADGQRPRVVTRRRTSS
ncbi:MAG: hypothetical protein ACM3MJ_09370 [Deltaproteobacteria bacterium]